MTLVYPLLCSSLYIFSFMLFFLIQPFGLNPITSWYSPQPVLISGHDISNPVQEVADSGIDTIHVFIGTPFTPAHYAHQEPGFLVACHQRAAAVTFAGVLASALQPSTEHVPGDVKLRVEAALLQRNPRYHQTLKDRGWGTETWQAAPTRYGGVTDCSQCSAEGAVLGRKTNGHHVCPQFQWTMEF